MSRAIFSRSVAVVLAVLPLTLDLRPASGQAEATGQSRVARTAQAPVAASLQSPMPTRRIVLQLSRELFAPIVDRRVDRISPVTDVILGTRVQGQAHTVGQPRLDLVDDPESAAFVIVLNGTNVS